MLQKGNTRTFLWRSLQVGLLLSAVLLGQIDHPLQHWLAHSAANVHIHHAEAEADPCHRATYHQDLEQGCEHNAHIATPDFSCPDCDYIFKWSVEELASSFAVLPARPSALLSIPFTAWVSRWLPITFLRGPPLA